MLPWLRNVQIVDITANRTNQNLRDSDENSVGEQEDESPLPHVEMSEMDGVQSVQLSWFLITYFPLQLRYEFPFLQHNFPFLQYNFIRYLSRKVLRLSPSFDEVG